MRRVLVVVEVVVAVVVVVVVFVGIEKCLYPPGTEEVYNSSELQKAFVRKRSTVFW